jgi:hypothetical protein
VAPATPLRWVLYTMEPVTTIATANTIIDWYERRPTIEDCDLSVIVNRSLKQPASKTRLFALRTPQTD